MIFQRTLKRSISLRGIGLHSGKEVRLILRPARPNRGIVFVRTDLPHAPEIPARVDRVVNTQLATTIGIGDATVSTIEHLLAAFQGLNVDNAVVEVDGPEVPIMDGSAAPFIEAILKVGIESQLKSKSRLALRRRVDIKVGDKWAIAEPSSKFEVHASIQWNHPLIGNQEFHYIEGKTSLAELAGARTFGFIKDVEMLKRMGLAQGGSLENAVVLDDCMVLNPEGLRFRDEFVRHKVLDALGDFRLAGYPIQGYFRLHCAGHDLHRQLMMEILKNPDNYEIVDSLAKIREESRLLAAGVSPVADTRVAATY